MIRFPSGNSNANNVRCAPAAQRPGGVPRVGRARRRGRAARRRPQRRGQPPRRRRRARAGAGHAYGEATDDSFVLVVTLSLYNIRRIPECRLSTLIRTAFRYK